MIHLYAINLRRQICAALAAFTVVLLASVTCAHAASVTIQWDSNKEGDIAGYSIEYGNTSHSYSASVDVGNRTSYQFTNLEGGKTYYFALRAYNTSGGRSDLSSEVSTQTVLGPLALRNLVSSLSSPRAVGTTIVFAAAPSDGTPPYQYKWLVSDGTTTTVAQNWSGTSTFSWQPFIAKTGYSVTVWVRNSTSTADKAENAESMGAIPFTITLPGAQGGTGTMGITSLTADRPLPQQPGTTIKFTAAATGGTAPYQYRWLLSSGGTWRVMQNWSASNTFAWTPLVPNTAYVVRAQARSAGNSTDAPENGNSDRTMPFEISSDIATSIAVTSDKDGPQTVGTPITFNATAFGAGSAYEFQWSVFNGVKWTTLQDWSRTSTYTWIPTSPNPLYRLMVRVRGGKDLSANVSVATPFPIQ